MTNQNVFVFADGQLVLSPKDFGYWSVQWAVDGGNATLEGILSIPNSDKGSGGGIKSFLKDLFNGSNSEIGLRGRIKESPLIANFHIIAFQTAVYYFYCSYIQNVPKFVLEEILIGIKEGIKCLNVVGQNMAEKKILQANEEIDSRLRMSDDSASQMFSLVKMYANALDDEFSNLEKNHGLASSSIYQSILGSYNSISPVQADVIERTLIFQLLENGIMACIDVMKDQQRVQYMP